jgi:hypothetical protein
MIPRSARESGFDQALEAQLRWERHGFEGAARAFNYTPGSFETLWLLTGGAVAVADPAGARPAAPAIT